MFESFRRWLGRHEPAPMPTAMATLLERTVPLVARLPPEVAPSSSG